MNKHIKINKLKLAGYRIVAVALTFTPMSIIGLSVIFMGSCLQGILSLPKDIRSFFKPTEKIVDESKTEFTPLHEDHKLTKMADKMAKKEGIKFQEVSMRDNDYPVMNANISFPKKNEARIRFHGNPLEGVKNDNIAEGIIAHELGHKNNFLKVDEHLFNEITQSYLSFGCLAFLLSVFAEQINAKKQVLFIDNNVPVHLITPERPTLFALASLSFVIAAAIPHIAKKINHCVEHIADLRGAEIANPRTMIDTLNFLSQIEEQQKPDSALSETQNQGSLNTLWKKITFQTVYESRGYTHPSWKDRIGLLKKAFDIKDENAAWHTPAEINLPSMKNDF